MCRHPVNKDGGIAQLRARGNSGHAAAKGQRANLGGSLPLTIQDCEVKLLVPLALKQGMFAVVSLETHPQFLHELGRMMIAALAFHEQAMDAEMTKSDVKDGRERLGQVPIAGMSRSDDEAHFALTSRGVGPVQADLTDQ